jgi:phosphate transport system permease protein
MNTNQTSSPVLSALKSPAIIRRRQWRMLKDKIVKHLMTVGGISVIIAIVLIFFYLLYVVFPLLLPASMDKLQQFDLPAPVAGETWHLAVEEKNEIGVRFTSKAHAVFFRLQDGSVVSDISLPIPENVTITSFAVADPATQVVAYGLSDGRALVLKHDYDITYPNDERVIKPLIKFPMGETPVIIDDSTDSAAKKALTHLDVQLGEESNTFVAVTPDNRLILSNMVKEISFLDDSVTFERSGGELSLPPIPITHLLLDKQQRLVYLADNEGYISRIDIRDITAPQIQERIRVVESGRKITAIEFLTGNISLLIGDSQGEVTQWFPARVNNQDRVLTQIRAFNEQQSEIIAIAPEERRKGFLAADSEGKVGFYNATAHRTLMVKPVIDGLNHIAISPRADHFVAENQEKKVQVWAVENEHPEVSWSALWAKVWYESHDEPKYIWQSSSASNDFEPKFSLMPLAFGTLKAAFYAMLIAIPLAIFGAIYTAYFMAPGMRSIVKPTIEIMEALPTVILGFLAGLWLAPVVEANLPGVFSLLLLMPIGVLLFAYFWRFMPKSISYHVPDGWQAALLIPVVLLVGWFSIIVIGPILEQWIFDGNMRQWLTNMGIDFDQRNALVVGMAMGLAVIPSIFSITEDAVFSVPKHLTSGSLALGATRWQTMTRVVILTASPGIFSAVMIGLGRAVGETMIVLMATGNTPVMDFSIFQGLRTLSANIAVEMPESEVNSTHYRVLFLSGLVLFLFTFFFNTLAEVVRQRLRRKYSSL